MLSCTSYLHAIDVPVQGGVHITKLKRKLKICTRQVSRKISSVEGCVVCLLRMWGMKITQKLTKEEV